MILVLKRFGKYLPIAALILIELILLVKNYAPGTYFLGWDNLFPEANFGENLRRSIFAVWQEYRGLGLLDGMSFAANLPHYLFLYLLHFLLPENILRYSFFFFMHFLGGLGMYFLLNKLFNENLNRRMLSFAGALFYLLNLATIQMFFAPYELFAVHFAFLPFLILFTIKYLETGFKKDLVFFVIFSIFSIPQAHVPTIFLVYILALLTVILINGKDRLQRVFFIIFFTFCLNAFWGLPYTYSTLTNTKVVANSKINQMSTQDDILKNKARGGLKDAVLMEGFWLDYTDSQASGNNTFIMPTWRDYINRPIFVLIGFVFFIISIVGALGAILRRERKFYPFILLFFFSFLMLGSNIPVLKLIPDFIFNFIPYFAQAFRFTFTKFSILYAFSFSVLLAIGLSLILENIRKLKFSHLILLSIFTIGIFYNSLPAFQGQFLYKNLKVTVPDQYFKLVDYFKSKGPGRIATLPAPSYWGWTYTNWGYRGSGFIWYGLPQATTDGAFFPWSRENENYYWEESLAIESSDQLYFDSLLQKYGINWIVLDKSIISQYSPKATSLNKLQSLIAGSQNLTLAQSFNGIDVYSVKQNIMENNFISIEANLPSVSPSYKWGNYDAAYLENGNYITSQESSLFYPFRSLFTGRKQSELEFKIEDSGNYFSFISKIPKNLAGSTLVIPRLFNDEISQINKNDLTETRKPSQILLDKELILANIEEINNSSPLDNSGATRVFLPYIHEGNLEIRVPKITGYYSYNNEGLFKTSFKNCNPFAKGSNENEKLSENGKNYIRLTSTNSDNCFSFDLPNLTQRIGYIVKVTSRNLEGKSLLFSIINKNSERPDFESYLPNNKGLTDSFFVIPPMENYGLGYNLYFDNSSIGDQKSINDLVNVEVHPIPYRFLTFLKIENGSSPSSFGIDKTTVYHPNPSFYEVHLDFVPNPQSTLILSQSYDPGWRAYEVKNKGLLTSIFPFFFSTEIKNHVLVNNWENGFVLNSAGQSNGTIIVVYLPQYLEYLGFLILLFVPIYLFGLKQN